MAHDRLRRLAKNHWWFASSSPIIENIDEFESRLKKYLESAK